ncbi:MAG: LysM peptidoglycan-binding domain-containing protein [Erythrobacter sp.]|nr:LysM peptidoglycan-binding domain-containing protein [Erythrobacter sp.]
MRIVALKRLVMGLFAVTAASASAAPDGDITYTVKPADTLYDLAGAYLVDRSHIDELRRINRVRNPRLMQVGTTLKIPRRLLKSRPVKLTLQSFSGSVRLTSGRRSLDPAIGLTVGEGVEIATGRNSFVSIAGDGNSKVSIPSNSRARIVDARRYLINGQIDIQLRVLRGRGEVVAPEVDGEGRYRVGTPLVVTAVRGTEFRVAFDPDREISLTEVVEGEVLVASGTADVPATAGFGVATAGEVLGQAERLLPAPELTEPGRIQTDETISFAIEPLEDAAAYRTQIARDAGFIEVLTEKIEETLEAEFEPLDDGRYFVRSRAISEVGLEGFSKVYSFRRKRVGVAASAEPAGFADAFKFAWRTEGTGSATHAFQLWNADDPGALLVDEVGLSNTAVLVSSLDPGTYRWKVATFQIDQGDVIKVWGPVQELTVSE